PWRGTLQDALGTLGRTFSNLHTGTDQFYTSGHCRLSLPPRDYRLRVFKGLEYRVHTSEIMLESGRTHDVTVTLKRWSHQSKRGWYSADSHLHIARPFPELNPYVSKFMQAEDINVGNLLQWGNARHFHNARQYAFGAAGLYHEGDYW